jgi:hypothetical protein
MSQRVSGYPRVVDDVFETPSWVTRVIAPYLRDHCLYVWDPANGPRSKIADVLRTEGLDVIATNDDFLSRTSLPYARIDGIMTNPPYGVSGKLACQFIGHALELVPVVVMLLRIDFDSGKTRTHLFRDCKSFDRKIVLLDRIVWFEREGAAGPSDNHAWFIWNMRHRGPATLAYARKTDRLCDRSAGEEQPSCRV